MGSVLMKIEMFSKTKCKKCACVWNLPIEARHALHDILSCEVKKCPFAKSKTWEWYDTLQGIVGADPPVYPDDPHDHLESPIGGKVMSNVNARKA